MLKILDQILHSDDITMIESSLTLFEAFCEHHDQSSLFADQTYMQQYQGVVRAYANLVSTRQLDAITQDKRPIHNRRRNAGLAAIRSIANSETLASAAGRQIDVLVPKILENLWMDTAEALDVLLHRVQDEDKEDLGYAMRRRTSISTVRTAEIVPDANPVAISGTALDVDKLAEEEIGVTAMQCLKNIFVVPNRPQIHAATLAVIKFIFERVDEGQSVLEPDNESGWATKLYGIIARWAPVQDRYVILVTTLDTLVKTPMTDEKLGQHTALAAMTGSLLRSDINLIGLSVMDILLGLIKQMKNLFKLQVGGGTPNGSVDVKANGSDAEDAELGKRRELLSMLEHCVGDLATHVYYTDQIPDMISAILIRLKPTRSASTTSTPQVENGYGNGPGAGSSVADLNDSQASMETYFSYKMGRISALRVIKEILLVANPRTKVSSHVGLARNRVPVQVWEGTQWLLRDPDGHVRKAYVDALVTWLDRETTRGDSRAREESLPYARSSLRNSRDAPLTATARRAVSNASTRDRPHRGKRSQFIPLLHLAMYDNALQYVDYDNDAVLLHVLLTKLTFKLGVNSARFAIPMVYRLQEDIQDLDTPIQKVRIAALCHGYFWALTEKFDFEASAVGRAIQNEVIRRRSKGFWIDGLHVPAPVVDQVGVPGQSRPSPTWDLKTLEKEEILPFDDRITLIECISTAYEESLQSPPTSPAASPGRPSATPLLSSVTASSMAQQTPEMQLPPHFREQMLTEFSRDEVVAALASAGKAESLNGSRTGTTATTRHRLTINTIGHQSNGHLPASPYGSQRGGGPRSAIGHADSGRLEAISRVRKTSYRSAVSPSASVSSRAGIASVEQLKMILSGTRPASAVGMSPTDDDSGDSMISYEGSPSEASYSQNHTRSDRQTSGIRNSKRSASASRREPLASNLPDEEATEAEAREKDDEVPPVPPLPEMHSSFKRNDSIGDTSIQDYAFKPSRRNLHSRAGESTRSSMPTGQNDERKIDLDDLLQGIDSRSGEGSLGNLTRPPY